MNKSIKIIFFTLMLGLNWLPVWFCATFYDKGVQFEAKILFIMLLLLIIGNFFVSHSLIEHVALSYCLIASAVIGTTFSTDCYTTYVSNDGWSYGIGFIETTLATLFVLIGSFIAFLIKSKELKKRNAEKSY